MNTEPSPRPWRVEENIVGWSSFIVDANGDGVAACWITARGDGEKERKYNEANARLIVDAVNERDRLRDIVRRAIPFVEGIVNVSVLVNADDPDIVPFLTKEQKAAARKAHEEAVPLLAEARAAIGEDSPASPCAPAPSVVSSSPNNEKP